MSKLQINVLENCHYCSSLIKLLNKNNIEYEKKNISDKNKYKYKNELIQTFPQIFLIVKKKKYLIGGYDIFINIFNNKQNLNIIKELSKNKFPYKIALRLIKLICKSNN